MIAKEYKEKTGLKVINPIELQGQNNVLYILASGKYKERLITLRHVKNGWIIECWSGDFMNRNNGEFSNSGSYFNARSEAIQCFNKFYKD